MTDTNKNGRHYIDKAEMQQALVDYRNACKQAQENGLPDPPIPNFIGECFVKIARHMSYRPNFIGYPFREEMISDGIENCLLYFRNYNPDKYNNPFGYFTKIIWYAFLRRIAREKKELAKKFKYIENIDITEMITQEHDSGDFTNQFAEYLKTELDHIDPSLRDIPVRTKLKSSDDIIETIVHELEEATEEPNQKLVLDFD